MTRSERRPLDIEHLNRYTGGDRAINEEVLRLFETSCTSIVAELELLVEQSKLPQSALQPAKAWANAAHTLKGAARSVGAFELAEAAEEAEKCGPMDRMAAIQAVQKLRARAEIVHLFIADFLQTPA